MSSEFHRGAALTSSASGVATICPGAHSSDVGRRAREVLLPYRGGLTDAEFSEAVGRLAAAYETARPLDMWRVGETHSTQLRRDAAARTAWLERATSDLERRWELEVALLRPIEATGDVVIRIHVELDATRRLDWLTSMLPRRLSTVRTGDDFRAEVDRLVDEATSRHRESIAAVLARVAHPAS